MKKRRTGMIGRAGICSAVALLAFGGLAAAESVVVLGTGRSGSWDTVLEISNGGSASMIIQLGPSADFQGLCPTPCPLPTGTLNPGQTLRFVPDDLAGFHPAGVGVTFVNSSTSDFTRNVTVRARTINTAVPTQSAEIPAVRLSTITSLNPDALAFPAATRTSSAHSNLLLAEVTKSGFAIVRIDALTISGTIVGSSTETVPSGGTLYLVDVLARLGVNALDDGQVRVTRLSGGTVWGWIGTVFPNAGVHIGLGKNP